MKSIIVSTCLNSIMSDDVAKRIGAICEFNENKLAAILSGVAVKVIGYDADALKKKIKDCIDIKNVELDVPAQVVTVYYNIKRWAKVEGETNYYNTSRNKSENYPCEVLVDTFDNFDVDTIEDIIDFEFV